MIHKKSTIKSSPVTFTGSIAKVVSTVVAVEGGGSADPKTYKRGDFLRDLTRVSRLVGKPAPKKS
jgi:hypothetical protein